MFTVITEGNNVSQRRSVTYGDIDHIIVVNKSGMVRVNQGNPITWPADASDGLQAIVDVKAGTLRFGYDGWPRAHTEFVVSNYVEDSAPVHVLDLITEWPTDGTRPTVLVSHPGFSWRHHNGGVWSICGMNGDSEFFEGDWLNYHENKKKQAAPHIFDLVESWPWGAPGINSNPALPEGWNWLPKPTNWLLSNGTVKLNVHDWSKHKRVAAKSAQPAQVTAASILTAALGHMEDRAKTYDAPGGERSMGKTVAAFNVITGLELTEEAGWLFMEILKQVRSQQGNYRADSYEDLVAYAALRGECAARERGNK